MHLFRVSLSVSVSVSVVDGVCRSFCQVRELAKRIEGGLRISGVPTSHATRDVRAGTARAASPPRE